MLWRRTRIGIVLLAIAIAGCGPTAAPPIAETLTGQTMGTSYHIHLAALSEGTSTAALQRRIDAALETVNEQMSTYRPESEISRFNASESTDWFPVSPATALVVAEAQRISAESDGAFDVTVMPLVNLWSFGPEARPHEIPTDAAIAKRKSYVGFRHLQARQEPSALRKEIPELQVDLSAIAKGYGVDVVAELLEEAGIGGYMVEIGGEVRTKGHKADGSPWRIGVEKPVTDRRAVQRILKLETDAVATSGDYRNFFQEDGVRYSHTIDPRTGRPIGHSLVAVSVLADSCMTADARATTVMVLGPAEGYNWLVERKIAAVLFVKSDAGFEELRTPAFKSRSDENPARIARRSAAGAGARH